MYRKTRDVCRNKHSINIASGLAVNCCYSHEASVSSVCLLASSSPRVLSPVAAVPLEARAALEALPTVRTAQVTCGSIVDPLVVVQDAGEAEGFAAREAHVLFPLRVNACVIPQSHGVGERLGAEGAAEMSRLVGVFVVEKRACMPVTTIAYVASEGPLLFHRTHICLRSAAARRAATDVLSQLLSRQKRLLALFTFVCSTNQAPPAYAPILSEVCTNMC